MYSLSMFLLFYMVVYAIKYLKNNNFKDLVFMIIFSILGIYSQCYVLLSAIIIYLILLIFNIKKYNEDKLKQSSDVRFIKRTYTEYKFKNYSLEKINTLYLDKWLSFSIYKVIYK